MIGKRKPPSNDHAVRSLWPDQSSDPHEREMFVFELEQQQRDERLYRG